MWRSNVNVMEIVAEEVHERKWASALQMTQEQKELTYSGHKRQPTLLALSGDVTSTGLQGPRQSRRHCSCHLLGCSYGEEPQCSQHSQVACFSAGKAILIYFVMNKNEPCSPWSRFSEHLLAPGMYMPFTMPTTLPSVHVNSYLTDEDLSGSSEYT